MTVDKTPAWQHLCAHYLARKDIPLQKLFAEDENRFANFSLALDDLLVDFSKTSLTKETVLLLCDLAQQAGVFAYRDSMFGGDLINQSESRAVLHTALRADSSAKILCDGENIMPQIIAEREKMLQFAKACRCGEAKTASGETFLDVVHIGIGGSDLGPAMATAALRPYHDGPRLHFVSNMDCAHIADTLAALDARRTLILISSKSFTTTETMLNAHIARQWLGQSIGEENIALHMAAMTAKPEKARQFGLERIFTYGEWVGGRYSLWGSAGLPLAIAIGEEHFLQFLRGAGELDLHFLNAPPEKNIPLMLGLLGIWHRNFCGYQTRAVLPYLQRLHLLPAYLQQLDMESNGKHVLHNGDAVTTSTVPVVWGTAATNAQHAYFQMLHQGTDIIPGEFIAAVRGHDSKVVENEESQQLLMANCFAQSAALLNGDNDTDKPPHRRFKGGRPSVTILFLQLTPYALGRLLALCEHRTFVEGAIWGVNSFDQWGVELGKTFATRLYDKITDDTKDEDSSTRGLVEYYNRYLTGSK